MRGAGSPSYLGVAPDGGAGSPSALTGSEGDLGAGSPTMYNPASLSIAITPDGGEYGDYGGDIARVVGIWPLQGPYRCRITSDAGVTYYPDADGCYGAREGKGPACETDPRKRLLTFSVPPAPLGTYDLEIAYGPGFGTSITLTGAIEILSRDRSLETWGMRRTFPQWVATGGRTSQGTPAENHPTRRPILGVIETLTRAFGMGLAETFGRPVTRVRGFPFVYGDAFVLVESTLGFPESGVLFIGTSRYSYSNKTGSSFTGLELLGTTDFADKPVFTEVVLDAHTILAT